MRRPDGASALGSADYRWFVTSRTLWALASQMVAVAVGFQVYAITGDPFHLGLIGLALFLPYIAFTLPAGHVADTYDRKRILAACYLGLAATGLALGIVTIDDPSDPAPIIALLAVMGAIRAVALPTSQAIVPNVVSTQRLPSAIAVNSTTFQAASIVGPSLAGLLLVIGPEVVYGATVAGFGVAAVCLAPVAVRSDGRRDREPLSVATLLSGVRFVLGSRVVLGLISLDMFAVLFGGALALLPVYAADILDVGPTGLGVMRAAPAIGAVVGALALSIRPLRRGIGPWLFGSVAAFGIATIVFATSTSFPLTIVALVSMGLTDMVSVYIRNLVVQLETPDAIRGRVSAVNGVFVGASNELGDFESGLTASWWGPVTAALVGGVATVVIAVAWAAGFPSVRRMDGLPQPVAERGIGPEPAGAPASVVADQ